jgi:uncharacterized protein (TIGR03084 family)
MTVFDDLAAEQDRLEAILLGLTEAQWLTESGAPRWSVADVVLHLAQTEEAVVTTAGAGAAAAASAGADPGATIATRPSSGGTVDDFADQMVRAERDVPERVFARWQKARRAAADTLRAADPQQPLRWVAGAMKPATLATTRLAEHWAHGLDITGPLGIGFPDTERLRHIAWLAHRTLPYALSLAGRQPADVRCEVISPDGSQTWRFGADDALSAITGPAGEFCRVAAQRLDRAAAPGLIATGPHGATALRVLRTYAL